MLWTDRALCRLPNNEKHFIEVKSSINTKNHFDISRAEMAHADMHRGNYTIFRVFGAGTRSPSLLKINDPSSKLEQGLLKNWMVIPLVVC